jgi:hypothetical protein
VSSARLLQLVILREQVLCVLADGLEHRVATVAAADQAVLDERVECVEVGAGDLLRRCERAAADEDSELRE